jgi:hypothetical protein
LSLYRWQRHRPAMIGQHATVVLLARQAKSDEGKDDSCKQYQANVEHPPSL